MASASVKPRARAPGRPLLVRRHGAPVCPRTPPPPAQRHQSLPSVEQDANPVFSCTSARPGPKHEGRRTFFASFVVSGRRGFCPPALMRSKSLFSLKGFESSWPSNGFESSFASKGFDGSPPSGPVLFPLASAEFATSSSNGLKAPKKDTMEEDNACPSEEEEDLLGPELLRRVVTGLMWLSSPDSMSDLARDGVPYAKSPPFNFESSSGMISPWTAGT
mmetsp:Transcript_18360/g.50520  ORF Transcript_18360/g.50520 Transcript_18360/m.50520 type:complete len:219 (-) Transcript_18360:741-1397(-)